MNKIIIFFLIRSTVADLFKKNISTSILQQEHNFLNRINENLHNLTNKLFTSLKLDQKITEITRIKLLLTMHDNLKIIAENNIKTYKDIENTVLCDKTINTIFKLPQVIEEIFKEKHSFNILSYISIENFKNTLLRNFKETSSIENHNALIDSLELITDSFNKLDGLTLKILMNSLTQFVDESEMILGLTPSKRLFEKKFRNLKKWGSSNSSEFLTKYDTIDSRRIFQGRKTNVKKFPFVVSVHINGAFMCAGAILSEDLVITAASCLQLAYNNKKNFKGEKSNATIRVGSDYTSKHGNVIPITDVYSHPKYDPVHLRNNLAIVRIKKILDFGQKQIIARRIEYDKVKAKLPERGGLLVVGWGDTDTDSIYKGPLTIARIKIYRLEACKTIYTNHYVGDKNFCAGFYRTGSGACKGDSGGPGIIGNRLVGLVSFGSPVCGTPDAPTVFTKLGFYADWIDGVIKNKGSQHSTKSNRHVHPLIRDTTNVQPTTKYTQQLNSLRSLLNNLLQSLKNKNFLYPDLHEEEWVWSSTKRYKTDHPLVNMDWLMIPGVHTLPPHPSDATPGPLEYVLTKEPPFDPDYDYLQKIRDIIGPLLQTNMGHIRSGKIARLKLKLAEVLNSIDSVSRSTKQVDLNDIDLKLKEPTDSIGSDSAESVSKPFSDNYEPNYDISGNGLSIEVTADATVPIRPNQILVSSIEVKSQEVAHEKLLFTTEPKLTKNNNNKRKDSFRLMKSSTRLIKF